MFNLALKFFLLLSPVLFLPLSVPGLGALQFYQFGYFGVSPNLFQLQFFQYGVIFLFVSALFDKPKRFFQDKYLSILFLICAVNVYFHPRTIKEFPIVVLGFLLFYLVSTYADVRNLKPVFKIIFFVSLLNTIFSILQFFNIHLIYTPTDNIIGLMGYKTQLGIYQALALPICFVIHPLLSIVPLVGLILSKSATAILPAILGMYYLLRKRLRIQSIPVLLSIFTIITLIFLKSFHKFSLRFEVWTETIKMILKDPFYGHGIGNFNYIQHLKYNINISYQDPYSLYLQVFYSLGILGGIAFLFFIEDKIIGFKSDDFIQRGLFSSCLILLTFGMCYSFLNYSRLAGTAIVLFGLLVAVKKDERKILC